MKAISIINLKGGCAKSTTAINTAALLAMKHKKRVLLIDNDPQGNTSQFFGAYDENTLCGSAEILTNKEPSNTWQVLEGVNLIDATRCAPLMRSLYQSPWTIGPWTAWKSLQGR